MKLTRNIKEAVRALSIDYNILAVDIRKGKYSEIYKVRATKHGKTKDYIRILKEGSRSIATSYAEFEELEDASVDIDYYIETVKAWSYGKPLAWSIHYY